MACTKESPAGEPVISHPSAVTLALALALALALSCTKDTPAGSGTAPFFSTFSSHATREGSTAWLGPRLELASPSPALALVLALALALALP